MKKHFGQRLGSFAAAITTAAALLLAPQAMAAIPPPGPSSGSSGVQGTVKTPAPTQAASIATPSNGQSFSTMPVTVAGLCTSGLLVKIFANNVFVGAAECNNGSYTLQITLFDGANELVARQFDALDQPGPDSGKVNVTYNNSKFSGGAGQQFFISSLYALRGADPGEQLNWPLTINGGNSPFAVSVDWGDSKAATLYSEPTGGPITVSHTYSTAGTYVVIVKGTDKDGQTAFLQLVAQANGAVTQSTTKASNSSGAVIATVKVLWAPAALCIPLIVVSFWLGRRYELAALRRHLEGPGDE